MRVKQKSVLGKLLLIAIRGYQLGISRLMKPCCRFYPSCSQYAYESIETHGAMVGCWLSIKRIIKCQPFNLGGYDPVPPKHDKAN